MYSNYNDAIKGNNLKALKWLKEKGYTWNMYTIALVNENPEILEWLKNQNCNYIELILSGIGAIRYSS